MVLELRGGGNGDDGRDDRGLQIEFSCAWVMKLIRGYERNYKYYGFYFSTADLISSRFYNVI